MDKKRMKRMIGIAIPMALIITGISYNGYIRMHTRMETARTFAERRA